MHNEAVCVTIALLLALPVFAAGVSAQPEPDITHPTLEEELAGPFSFYLAAMDQVGFKDCPEGTMMTFDGAFMTSFGELDLFVGPNLVPVNQRIRTLYEGHLPIFEYSETQGDIIYRVESFSATRDLDPRNELLTFVRVTMTNPGPIDMPARLRVAFVEKHGKLRHELPCTEWYRDRFMDAESFESDKRPRLADGDAWWGEHLAFAYSRDGLVTKDGRADEAAVTYAFTLAPDASAVVDLKLPYVPIYREKTAEIDALNQASFENYFRRTVDFWNRLLARAVQIDLPDPKVMDTAKMSLVNMLTSRDVAEDGKHFIQKVNEINYDYFYMRDTAYMVRVYDMMGLHDIARETLDHYIIYGDDGKPQRIRSEYSSPDDWGQTLWAIGSHFRATGDMDFARFVYPMIPPHVDMFDERTHGDPRGLWPATNPYDNEVIYGHYTGHNFWGLLGLREAINLAKAVGADEDAARYERLRDEYRDTVMKALRDITAKTEGYIPPGLDDPLAGKDWANASGGVYPFGVLDPGDPMVTATVEAVRGLKYQEGIMTYGPNAWTIKQAMRTGEPIGPGGMHHYETFYVDETLLARGEQEKVVEDLYAILAHTSSTHSGFEWEIWPWGSRYAENSFTPHSWFAARTIELVRNMLAREDGDTLHLASALSSVWLKAGTPIGISGAPTDFGKVSVRIEPRSDGADVHIDSEWRKAPKRILFHVPWFVELVSASADGASVTAKDGAVGIPSDTKTLSLVWRWKEEPPYSFWQTTRNLLEKYHNPIKGMDRSFLYPRPQSPQIVYDGLAFEDAAPVSIVPGDRHGTIHYTLDGSVPTGESPVYSRPFEFTDSTLLRAVTVWEDGRVSTPDERYFEKLVPRAAERVTGLVPGVRYGYVHEHIWECDAYYDFQPQRAGVVDAFRLDGIERAEMDYGIGYRGYISVPRDGVYTFHTTSDDGSVLYIGDKMVVDNDRWHGADEKSGKIALKKGFHPIRVLYFELYDDASLSVSWEGPGIAKQEIPPSALFHAPE